MTREEAALFFKAFDFNHDYRFAAACSLNCYSIAQNIDFAKIAVFNTKNLQRWSSATCCRAFECSIRMTTATLRLPIFAYVLALFFDRSLKFYYFIYLDRFQGDGIECIE
jgi:hypothetical protein